jgi:hypothetical protein
MSVRRSGPLVLAALLVGAACGKSVSEQAPRPTLVVAVYASPSIPTPNDLALQAVPTLPASAQRNLLQSFVASGGFPADQAPTLSVPLRAYGWDAATSRYVPSDTVPTIDPATVTSTSAALFRVDVTPVERIDVEAVDPEPAGFVNFVPAVKDGSRRLPAGRYVFAVRGGDLGVKTTEGLPIAADVPVALTIPNKDLTNPNNQPPGGIPDSNGDGSNADELAQLRAIQTALWAPSGWVPFVAPGSPGGTPPQWALCAAIPEAARPAGCAPAPAPAYPTIDAAFPHQEIASIAAFQIAPPTGETLVAVDAASGQAPLPFDLLRTGPDGHIALNRSFGSAAQGLTSLDGFSTTAMILAQVITPGAAQTGIRASTVAPGVRLYKLGGGAPELLAPLARYLPEPPPIVVPEGEGCPAAGGCSEVIGLQPAVNIGVGYIPALEEDTTFAVVVTKGVQDLAGHPIGRPTFMTLLLDPNPVSHPVTHQSLVGGLDDATAVVLQQMKTDLAPVIAAVGADQVALAYTFKTQKVTHDTIQLAGLPYQAGAGTVLSVSSLTPAQAAAQYGVDAAAAHLDAPSIAGFAEVQLGTVSLLLGSQNQGAFDPAHPTPEAITALVALPNPALVTGSCPPGMGFTAAHCAPLVVFRHGITRSKADLLPIAYALTSAGFVVAAIDAEKHGDRSWCESDAECCPAALCGTASTCAFKANLTGPTDGTKPFGVCESSPGVRGGYLDARVDCQTPFLDAAQTQPNPDCFSPKGVPFISGRNLVSLNFFRTRDSLRQDVIDQTALVKALAPYGPSADVFAQLLLASGYAVDPTQIHWVSQSLGSGQGAVDLAANPRFTRAVFNAPGATLVDIFGSTDSAFHQTLLDLIDPIKPGTADYLKLLQVAKWILDPADPANFAPHVLQDRLTSPLDALLPALPSSRSALAQFALCDPKIPNAQNAYFASQLGLTVPAPTAGGDGRVEWFIDSASGATCPADGATHGFLLDGVHATLTVQAQSNATAFLLGGLDQPVTVRP